MKRRRHLGGRHIRPAPIRAARPDVPGEAFGEGVGAYLLGLTLVLIASRFRIDLGLAENHFLIGTAVLSIVYLAYSRSNLALGGALGALSATVILWIAVI